MLDRGYASWSLENVATPAVVACLREIAQQHPTRVAFMVLDAADYGVPSSMAKGPSLAGQSSPSPSPHLAIFGFGLLYALWRSHSATQRALRG